LTGAALGAALGAVFLAEVAILYLLNKIKKKGRGRTPSHIKPMLIP
jgi:hypothetical protein